MNTYGPTGIIPIPTYLLSDDELYNLIDRIEYVAVEVEHTSDKDKAAIAAIEAELKRRGTPIRSKGNPDSA